MPDYENINELTKAVINAATEVHQIIGPGMMKSVYQECLGYELELRNIPFERRKKLSLEYKGAELDSGFQLDFVVADRLIIELRNNNGLQPADEARMLTYLYLTRTEVGLLIDFNVPILKDGIKEVKD
ncbi:MAG: GxxExxY protein [Desulfobacterales bacterium]